MLRLLLALAVIGLVIVTMMRMMGSQLGGMARVTGADLGASAPAAAPAAPAAPATPRGVVDQAGQSVQRALQQGAAGRASEAGN
jgi:hypothetical protein